MKMNFRNLHVTLNMKELNHYRDVIQTKLSEFVYDKYQQLSVLMNEHHTKDYTVAVFQSGTVSAPPPFLLKHIDDAIELVPNQRNADESEPTMGILLIDYVRSEISHNGMNGELIKQYIKKKTGVSKTSIMFRNKIDKVKFFDAIKTVKEASFRLSDPNNLFASRNKLYDEMANEMFDYGMKSFRIEMKMKPKQNTGPLKKELNKLFNNIEEGSTKDIKSIRVVGTDAWGVEQVFNQNNIYLQIELDIPISKFNLNTKDIENFIDSYVKKVYH